MNVELRKRAREIADGAHNGSEFLIELAAHKLCVEDAMKEMDVMSMIDRSFDFSNGFAKALAVLRVHLSRLNEEEKT